jgi:DNA-binding IclR family transcriptional regulator
VLNQRKRPLAIVSVWGPQHRVFRERLPELGRRAARAAAEITQLLGH